MVDKIGNVNNIVEPKKVRSAQQNTAVRTASDSVQISSEGMRAAEEAHLAQIVKDAPDIRADKVREIKQMMADGSYDRHLDEKILGAVAERLVKGIFRD